MGDLRAYKIHHILSKRGKTIVDKIKTIAFKSTKGKNNKGKVVGSSDKSTSPDEEEMTCLTSS